MDDVSTAASSRRDPEAELARMSRLVRRVNEAIAGTLAEAGMDATGEQRLDVLARIFGYRHWRKMVSHVQHGNARISAPGPMAAANPLMELLGIDPTTAARMATRISDQYDDRNATLANLAAALAAKPDLADVDVGDLRLKNGDTMRLRKAGIATLGELPARWEDLDPYVLGRVMRRMVMPMVS